MTTSLTRMEILGCYLRGVLVWALFGVAAAYVLVSVAFVFAAPDAGLTRVEALTWTGFHTMCALVAALIGGGAGVEVGQERAYAMHLSRKHAMRIHPAVRAAVTAPVRTEAECDTDPDCQWTCAHLSDRLNGPRPH